MACYMETHRSLLEGAREEELVGGSARASARSRRRPLPPLLDGPCASAERLSNCWRCWLRWVSRWSLTATPPTGASEDRAGFLQRANCVQFCDRRSLSLPPRRASRRRKAWCVQTLHLRGVVAKQVRGTLANGWYQSPSACGVGRASGGGGGGTATPRARANATGSGTILGAARDVCLFGERKESCTSLSAASDPSSAPATHDSGTRCGMCGAKTTSLWHAGGFAPRPSRTCTWTSPKPGKLKFKHAPRLVQKHQHDAESGVGDKAAPFCVCLALLLDAIPAGVKAGPLPLLPLAL